MFAKQIMSQVDADRLQGIANAKTLEMQNINQKQQMKQELKKRKIIKIDKKEGILNFRQSIQKMGLLKTIKGKMNNFLRIVRDSYESKGINPEREINDFKDFLEEFLISGDFSISSNSFLINYIKQDDRNLDIIIQFITNPYNYSVSRSDQCKI